MMNVKVFVIALVALVVVGAAAASAQTPYVGVFFDRAAWDPPPSGPPVIGDGTTETILPPGVFGEIDSVYIVAYNFNCFVTGIELKVEYPAACLQWVADIDTQPVTIGSTPTGMSMGWPLPQNGFSAINVVTVIVQWVCTDCSTMGVPVRVVGHPLFNPEPRYTCFNIPQQFPAVGLTALICPAVPVEETTWGRVKSMYSQ